MKQTFYEVGCDVDSINRIDKCLVGTGIIYSRDEDDYEYEDYFTFVYIPSTGFCDIAVSDFWKDTKEEIKEVLIENMKDNNCFDK